MVESTCDTFMSSEISNRLNILIIQQYRAFYYDRNLDKDGQHDGPPDWRLDDRGTPEFSEKLFEINCLRACTNNTFSDMWCLMGLTSVVRRVVYSCYPPDRCPSVRQDLERIIYPLRNTLPRSSHLFIFWTNTSAYNLLDINHWRPNHFVLCLVPDDENHPQPPQPDHKVHEPAIIKYGLVE